MKKSLVGIIFLLLFSILSVVNVIGVEVTSEVTTAATPTIVPDGGPSDYGKIFLLNNKKTIKLGRSFKIKVTGYRSGSYVYYKNRKNLRKPMDNKDLLKKRIRFTSKNKKVAKVNKYGVITTKKPGKCVIKVKMFRKKFYEYFYLTVKK